MKIVVTAEGKDLDAQASSLFGRCPYYIFVDPESLEFEAIENPALNASGGAGIQAAQLVAGRGVEAVVSGNVGPNAFEVLHAAGLTAYLFGGGTVRQAIEAYKAGSLPIAASASGPAHAGMGAGFGRGRAAR